MRQKTRILSSHYLASVCHTNPNVLTERGKEVKTSLGKSSVRSVRKDKKETDQGKGGGWWNEACRRQRLMHLKPKSAEAMVGEKGGERGGRCAARENEVESGKSAETDSGEMDRWKNNGVERGTGR